MYEVLHAHRLLVFEKRSSGKNEHSNAWCDRSHETQQGLI